MIHTPTQLIFPRDQIPIGSISSCCTHDYNEPTNSCHILKWFWNDSEMIHTATEAILSRDQMPLGSILSCCSSFVLYLTWNDIWKLLVCLLTKYLATLFLIWKDIWKLSCVYWQNTLLHCISHETIFESCSCFAGSEFCMMMFMIMNMMMIYDYDDIWLFSSRK